MPDDIPESKRLSDLRKRAEKALQERRSDNLESTELSNEEMHSLIHESATTSRAGGMRMASGRGRGHLCWWPLIFKKNF